MAPKVSNFSITSTGTKSVTSIPFLPSAIQFIVSQRLNTTDTASHVFIGWANVTNQMVSGSYADPTGAKTEAYTDKCIYQLNRLSGSITSVLAADFISVDNNGGGDYGFTINVSVALQSYRVQYVAFP